MAFPIGFLLVIDNCIIASVIDFEINSKLGVFPLIIEPTAIKPSNFLRFLDITTGISKAPETLKVFTSIFFSLFDFWLNCYGFDLTLSILLSSILISIIRIENKNYDLLIIETIIHLKKNQCYF